MLKRLPPEDFATVLAQHIKQEAMEAVEQQAVRRPPRQESLAIDGTVGSSVYLDVRGVVQAIHAVKAGERRLR